MTYYVSKSTNDILKNHINTYYQTYLDAIATLSGVVLKSLTSVEIGGSGFADKNRERPYMIIEPVADEIDDELPGNVESVLKFDILVEADAFQESEALTLVGLYKDAFVSMIISNNTLAGEVTHARVRNIEQFPGGTGTSKYILMAVEITVDQGR